jgi:DNA-binding IclR family transcriptional regulator
MSDLGKFKVNDSQQRVLQIVLCLAGNELDGLTPAAIAKAVKSTSNRIHHDLRNLAQAGFAERLRSGNWRLGPKMIQLALDYQSSLVRIDAAAEEIKQRYQRTHS